MHCSFILCKSSIVITALFFEEGGNFALSSLWNCLYAWDLYDVPNDLAEAALGTLGYRGWEVTVKESNPLWVDILYIRYLLIEKKKLETKSNIYF
jgi:hypothetical protein